MTGFLDIVRTASAGDHGNAAFNAGLAIIAVLLIRYILRNLGAARQGGGK